MFTIVNKCLIVYLSLSANDILGFSGVCETEGRKVSYFLIFRSKDLWEKREKLQDAKRKETKKDTGEGRSEKN